MVRKECHFTLPTAAEEMHTYTAIMQVWSRNTSLTDSAKN